MYEEKFYYSPWFIGILFTLWFLIVPPIVAIILIYERHKKLKEARVIWMENKLDEVIDANEHIQQMKGELLQLSAKKLELTKELDFFKPVTDVITIKAILEQKIQELKKESQDLNSQIQDTNILKYLEQSKKAVQDDIDSLLAKKAAVSAEIQTRQQELTLLYEDITMQSFGLYTPKYAFEGSEAFQNTLNNIRQKQKQMVKDRVATSHLLDRTMNNNNRKGKEKILNTIKLILRAFNNECDNIIATVKFSNVGASERRIKKVFEELNKLTNEQQVSITNSYLNLKIEELYLKYEYEQKKQEEKHEQMKIKERMREEATALKELEKAKEKVEKEEKHFEQAIKNLKKQLEETDETKQAQLHVTLQELEKQLAVTRKNKEDVLHRVQNTRAGYVYIVSNIGSFGENIYKIGMTRRLEPLDRVRELGDASVPFTFDVHGMIFSEDAPTLENALHSAFADRRLNKVNERKEFFCVSLREIEEVVKQNHNKTVEFTKLAKAEEYRQSKAIEQKTLQAV
ncbi:DUF4041 domain-containing protein [Peribacillus sp. SCS-155]|uniref:DUF4041 domain-containing protein n=1 Tax=Peribacillus sedimenti TaxID=3115297 RepID=UPI0039065BBF